MWRQAYEKQASPFVTRMRRRQSCLLPCLLLAFCLSCLWQRRFESCCSVKCRWLSRQRLRMAAALLVVFVAEGLHICSGAEERDLLFDRFDGRKRKRLDL
ncbi:unnamed protein product [Phaeothamnion confervicola]